MQNIKFLDLNKQQKTIEKSLKSNLDKVLSESNYIMGPEVKDLESKHRDIQIQLLLPVQAVQML